MLGLFVLNRLKILLFLHRILHQKCRIAINSYIYAILNFQFERKIELL